MFRSGARVEMGFVHGTHMFGVRTREGVLVKRPLSLAVCLLLAVSVCVASVWADEPYKEGEQMAEIVLEDQHGETGTIDGDTRQVLFTRDMDAGDVVKAALAHDGAALLEAGGTVYLADISGMPSLVRYLFALPKLRKREYLMLLDFDGEATRRIPGKSGSATLIGLDGLKITGFRYLADTDEVTAALGVSKSASSLSLSVLSGPSRSVRRSARLSGNPQFLAAPVPAYIAAASISPTMLCEGPMWRVGAPSSSTAQRFSSFDNGRKSSIRQ